MSPHVCPWWGGYFIDNPLRRWLHDPQTIVGPLVRPGMTVLDFGCGMGLFSLALARLVGPDGLVLAVDLQPQMLAAVRRRAAKAGLTAQVRTHQAQAHTINLQLPIDFALAFASVHEVPDVRQTIGEIQGLLRPGGQWLVVEPRGHVPPADFERMVAIAQEFGLVAHDGPAVRLCRAVVFHKPE